jgi:Uma2 family endonuclease
MAATLQRRLFSVDEYEQMGRAGIFCEDERIELLDGEIVQMSPIGSPHAWCVKRLLRGFSGLGDVAIISVQDPIRLGPSSLPEPDLALLRPEAPQDRHPEPAEVLLVVEVADSSVNYDRETKAPLYGRSGLPELWLVDPPADRIEVHREPSPSGYRLVRYYQRGERLSPLFAPHFEVEVDTILGPVAQ